MRETPISDAPRPDEQSERQDEPPVQHAYPPPVLPAGTETTAYCGVKMTVGGVGGAPPADACPLCVVVWQQRKRRRS